MQCMVKMQAMAKLADKRAAVTTRATCSKAKVPAGLPSAVCLSAPNVSAAVQGLIEIAHPLSPPLRRSGRERKNATVADVWWKVA